MPRTASNPPNTGMAPWVRNSVMLVTLGGWVAVVAAYIAQGELPDAPLLGVPGAVYFALSPTLIRRKADPAPPAAPAADEGAV